ncbi:MAG: GTPase [Planctomycetota bacterium]
MSTQDTIAALATPPGRSPCALIRVSGPAVPAVLAAILDTPPTVRGVHNATLHLPRAKAERTLERDPASEATPIAAVPCLPLPVSLLYFTAPHSYTTDTTVELQIPGNPHLIERVLDLVLSFDGVRLANPGEFTYRAHLAGQLTLDQAEGVAALIAADRDDELDAANELLRGTTGARYRAWSDELSTVLALVEAGIDFTDQEDVVPIAPSELSAKVATLRDAIAAHAGDPSEQRSGDPEVALVGPPSAGKSTLFNALLGQERSITDESPGTTRDVLAEPLDLSSELPGAGRVTLLDLPGLDLPGHDPSGSDTLEIAAQSSARDAAKAADLLIHCDPSGRFDPDPGLADRPTLRVRTKADLPGMADGDVAVCALDGFHLDTLRRAIADCAFARSGVPRHALALAEAAGSLGEALATIDPGARSLAEPELVAGAMRTALDQLGQITGDVTPDDVIGRVFAAFCVGK